MRRGLALIAAAALLGAGCGGDDDEGGSDKGGSKPAANASSIECLTLSTLSPEVLKSPDEADKTIRPLLTPGAKAAAILTGRLGADVIEYPDAAAASDAQQEARESKTLAKQLDDPGQIELFDRTLLIDYTREPHVRKVVQACANNPDQPPPTP